MEKRGAKRTARRRRGNTIGAEAERARGKAISLTKKILAEFEQPEFADEKKASD